ncbi:unnamed protein product [Diamesa hyperborea]
MAINSYGDEAIEYQFTFSFVIAFASIAAVSCKSKGSSYVSRQDSNGPSEKIDFGGYKESSYGGDEKGLYGEEIVYDHLEQYPHGIIEDESFGYEQYPPLSGDSGSYSAGEESYGHYGHNEEESHEGKDHYAPASYKYEYAVKDEKTGDHKTHWEHRDGDVVSGQYTLDEADGTKRIVTYSADKKNGFNAVVHNVKKQEHYDYHH